ncbi:MAG: hypothetical protein WCD38_09265 [Candidatus Tumulicola sp.]
MIASVRRRFALIACVLPSLAACSSPSAHERTVSTELAAIDPLKKTYSGVLMGFDVRGETTLLASLDLQAYIGTDDDTDTAMRRAVVEGWRRAWAAAHPNAHATLHILFIDFTGRTIAEKTTAV